MLKLNNIMIGTDQPKALIDFYKKVINEDPYMGEEDWAGWKVGGGEIHIGEHSEVKGRSSQPERIMMNFVSKDVQAEFDRIKEIGAEVIKEPYEMEGWEGSLIATFADPDGNYFQIMTPWDKE